MTGVRVYVATTEGPSEIQRVAEEDPEVRSVVCLNGTSEALAISAAYDAFVRKPTGVIERLFGHPVYRSDVSERISEGRSWQLPLFAAHALFAAGRLAGKNERADRAVWLTGTVDSELDVGRVDHVPEKLAQSERLFGELQSHGIPLTVFLPRANADGLGPADTDRLGPNAEIVPLETVDTLFDRLELPRPARPETLKPRPEAKRRHPVLISLLFLLAAGTAVGAYWQDEVMEWADANFPQALRILAGTGDEPGEGEPEPVKPTQPTVAPEQPAPPVTPAEAPVSETPGDPPTAADREGDPTDTTEPPTAMQPEPDPVPEPAPEPEPELSGSDLALTIVERRAPGARSCGVAEFGTRPLTETRVPAVGGGRLDASSAAGLCAVQYEIRNGFEAPVHVWLLAAPVGRPRGFGSNRVTATSLDRTLQPGDAVSVQLNLPRWSREAFSHRVIAIAAEEDAAADLSWVGLEIREIETSWDFGRWAELRDRIEEDGLALLSVHHEIRP